MHAIKLFVIFFKDHGRFKTHQLFLVLKTFSIIVVLAFNSVIHYIYNLFFNNIHKCYVYIVKTTTIVQN